MFFASTVNFFPLLRREDHRQNARGHQCVDQERLRYPILQGGEDVNKPIENYSISTLKLFPYRIKLSSIGFNRG